MGRVKKKKNSKNSSFLRKNLHPFLWLPVLVIFAIIPVLIARAVVTGAPPFSIQAEYTLPPTPTSFDAYAYFSNKVSVNWYYYDYSGNNPVKGYRVYRDGALIADMPTKWLLDDVEEQSTHSYYVTSYNEEGTESAPTRTITVTTPAANTTYKTGGYISCPGTLDPCIVDVTLSTTDKNKRNRTTYTTQSELVEGYTGSKYEFETIEGYYELKFTKKGCKSRVIGPFIVGPSFSHTVYRFSLSLECR